MSDYPNQTVQDAANKLIAALALHEDARGTVTDALHDMWDTGRDNSQPVNRCVHHGHEHDTEPCPECHPHWTGDTVLIPGTLLAMSASPDGGYLWHVQLDGPRDHVVQVPEHILRRTERSVTR